MSVVVLLIVLAVIVFLLAKSMQDARRQQAGQGAPASRSRARTGPRPASRVRPRRRRPALDEDALAAHVAKLREAIDTGLISVDEAIDSIVRQTDGALSEDAARRLLSPEDDAA